MVEARRAKSNSNASDRRVCRLIVGRVCGVLFECGIQVCDCDRAGCRARYGR
jgi:hypothetical protein